MAHIGGFFIFIGLAGLTIILWGLFWHCWLKKCCCLKEFHNPMNNRAFWWLCFIALCGIFACCISGFITALNFKNNINATKCAYERIFYDSQYGELNHSLWKGLQNYKENELFKKVEKIINNTYTNNFNFDNKSIWEKGQIPYLSNDIYYTKDFQNEIYDIIKTCNKSNGILRDTNWNILCDANDMENKNNYLIKYINNISEISRFFSKKVLDVGNFINNKKKVIFKEAFYNEENKTIEEFGQISEDLNNYQKDFLDKVYHYIDITKNWGYLLITIFYSVLFVISLISCFLLWAYAYFKQQTIIYIIMHIFWNILQFFSFSFLIFGTVFGALYKCSKDLIGYNMFLFSNENLSENVTTYLLPNKKSKEFLRYCLNDEENNYIKKLNFPITNIIVDLNKNLKVMNGTKDALKDFSEFKHTFSYNVIPNYIFRNLQEDNDEPKDSGERYEEMNFNSTGTAFQEMINLMYEKFYTRQSQIRLLEENNIVTDIEMLENDISMFDCGYLKSEINILYDSLYEMSIESRILCAINCSIGFIGEIAVIFYLLVMYHYNNNIFKEGKEGQPSKLNKSDRNFDQESRNEFMNKAQPDRIKENNRKLDLIL